MLNSNVLGQVWVAALCSSLLVACASTDAVSVSSADVRKCFKTDWSVASLAGASERRYSDYAAACQRASQTDIKPSQSRIALFNASRLHYHAALASTDDSQRAVHFGSASNLGQIAIANGFRGEDLSTQLSLLRAAHGSELELGLMEGVQRRCSSQTSCLAAGLAGLDQNAGTTITSALASNRKPMRQRASRLQVLEAKATSEFVRLREDGSVHLALENLQNVARQIEAFDRGLAIEAEESHTAIAIAHADLSMSRRDFSDAVEYMKLAAQFSRERNADLNRQSALWNSLGDMLMLQAVYKGYTTGIREVSGYCQAAKSYEVAFRATDMIVRAEALRGLGLAHAKIADTGRLTCDASHGSALGAYQRADSLDPSSNLARAHIETFADLLSPVNPEGSLALDRRRGGASRLDSIYQFSTATHRPDQGDFSNAKIPAALPSVSTWSIAALNTRARNYMRLARQKRKHLDFSDPADDYAMAVEADIRWPLAALELGELYILNRKYDAADIMLREARTRAEADPVRHERAYARTAHLLGQNELLRFRDGAKSNLTLALSESRRSASSSTEPTFKYQACLAALLNGSMAQQDIRLCELSGPRLEDEFFSAFGAIRTMQAARRVMDADYRMRGSIDETYRQKQRLYEREADRAEAAFQTLLGRPRRAARVVLPVTHAEFSVEDFARMGLYIGETCQNEYKDEPSIASDADMLVLLQKLKLDSCDAS